VNKFDFGKPYDVWQGKGALPVWFFPYKIITGVTEWTVEDNAYHWHCTEAAIMGEAYYD
jgi:hypothetical protein